MKNMKFWRTALVATLVLTVMLSVTGGTIAWFTDTVTSAKNKIQAGNLDVDLYMYDGTKYDEITDESDPIFGTGSIAQDNNAETLWEPGKTQVAYLKLKNNGNLALKYQVSLNVVDGTTPLSGAMLYAITPDAQHGSVTEWNAANAQAVVAGEQKVSGEVAMAAGAEHYFALSIHMNEAAGNEYQNGSATFDITVNATQDTVESDSFNNQYDKDAQYPVANAADLSAALAKGGHVVLGADIEAATMEIPADKNVVLDLNGYNLTNDPKKSDLDVALQNYGTLTIQGNGTISGDYAAVYSTGKLTVEGGTFESSNGFGLLVDNIYGTEASVAVINGGIFTGVGVYNPTDVTINGGTFNVGRDPDGATDHLSDKMTLFVNPTFVGAPNNATVTLNGGTFNGDIYVYDDGITETVFTNNGATINGQVLNNN